MTDIDVIIDLKSKKKKAYGAMSRMTLFLFSATFLSLALNYVFAYILLAKSFEMTKLLVALFVFFGVENAIALSAARQIISSGVLYEFSSIILMLLCMLLPAMLFAKFEKISYDDSFSLKGKMVKGFVPLFCLCQLFTTVSSLFAERINAFLVPSVNANVSQSVLEMSSPSAFVIRFICTCILVPVVEEFIFRGVMLSCFKRYGLMFAVVASATLFGVAHSSPVQSMYAFTFGIFSALLVCVTGNLKTSIAFHAINNAITMILNYLEQSADSFVYSVVLSVYSIFIFFFAFAGIYYLVKTDGVMDKFNNMKSRLDDAEILCPRIGMYEIMCLPFVAYVLIYAAEFIMKVM